MTTPKRIVPVSELKPGDSFRLPSGRIDFVVKSNQTVFGGVYITSIDNIYCEARVHAQWTHGSTELVTVGFTNRKAKRARGKMARRERRPCKEAMASLTASILNEQHGSPKRSRVLAIHDPVEVAAITGQRVDMSAGYGIPRPGQPTPDGTARIDSVRITVDSQRGMTCAVTSTSPLAVTTTVTAEEQAHGGSLPMAVTHFRRSLGPVGE